MKRLAAYVVVCGLLLTAVWRWREVSFFARMAYHELGGPNPLGPETEKFREYERRTGEKVHFSPAWEKDGK
jgi:hypothetical protein